MKNQWLVRYSEIFLKSDPSGGSGKRTDSKYSRSYARYPCPERTGNYLARRRCEPALLKNIFGIVSFSEVEHIRIDEIEAHLPDYCRRHGIDLAKTFAIKGKTGRQTSVQSNDKAIEYGNLLEERIPSP